MGVGAAIAAAGAATAIGSVVSSSIGASAASDAAQTQANAALQAEQLQVGQNAANTARLSPYVNFGNNALPALEDLTGTNPGGNPLDSALTARFQPTIGQLAMTPGYQFTLDQGLQAVQNSNAAQGLGISGSALKGAANYAEGLASTTYQQQLQNYLAQNQQTYNMLTGEVAVGENAAAGTGTLANQGLAQSNNLLTGAANANAAGTVGVANAISGGITGLTGAGQNTALMLALQNNGLFGNNTANANANAQTANLYGVNTPVNQLLNPQQQ